MVIYIIIAPVMYWGLHGGEAVTSPYRVDTAICPGVGNVKDVQLLITLVTLLSSKQPRETRLPFPFRRRKNE